MDLATRKGEMRMSGYINLNDPVCRTPEGEQIICDMFEKHLTVEQARELLNNQEKRDQYFLLKGVEAW